VDGVDAQEPGLPVGAGLAPLGDGHDPGSGLGEHAAPAAVGARLAQVVQVPVRQPRQAREALIAEHFVLAAQHRRVAGPQRWPSAVSTSASRRISAAV